MLLISQYLSFLFFSIFLFVNAALAWTIPSPLYGIETTTYSNKKTIALTCVYLFKRFGKEVIKNKCNSCRSVGLIRKRSGIPTPIVRRYIIPPVSEFPLPFRGPGQTRITNDLACKGNPNTQNFNNRSQLKDRNSSTSECVNLKLLPNGKVILINSCGSCRETILERLNATGRSLGRQMIKIKPHSALILKKMNASQIKIISQTTCLN